MHTKLTTLEAFYVMTEFLDIYSRNTVSGDIAVLLSGMQMHPDGDTWDPAAWDDWIESVDEVLVEQSALQM